MGTHPVGPVLPPPPSLPGCRSFTAPRWLSFYRPFLFSFLSLAYPVILKHELCVLMMRVFDRRIWSPLHSNPGQATQIMYLGSTVTMNCIFYEIQQRPYHHHLNTIQLAQTTPTSS